MDVDFDNQQYEPIMCDDSEGNAFRTIEDRIMDRKVDNSSSSLCLNLNSCPPVSPLMKPDDESLKGISSTLDEKDHSCAGKAVEAILSNDDSTTMENQVVDLAAQPVLNSGISSSKKPKKRACSTDSRLRRGASKRRNISLKTDMIQAKSKHKSKGELS